jgi:hypothetical protein
MDRAPVRSKTGRRAPITPSYPNCSVDAARVERMAPPNIAECLAQRIDVIDEKTQAALSQIGREEKAAAADEVSPIVRHRASIAQLKMMGFATLNPSYGLHKPNGAIMDSACEERPAPGQTIPYGLMSLWDMINCSISQLGSLCAQLELEHLCFKVVGFPLALEGPVEEGETAQVAGWMKVARTLARDFEWPAVIDRIDIIEAILAGKRGKITNLRLSNEVRVLLETVTSGLKSQSIYRYPKAKADVLWSWQADWAAVTKAFPSSQTDVFAGVDLWALGHATASIFHFMRVLEHGLRALAQDVGKTFDVQNWQNIIDQIESEIRQLGKTLSSGIEKTERLQFLSEAAKEFVYFKDGWRNYVSHGRGIYDEHQARSVMEHVRAFMTTLSSRLAERDA